MPSEDQPRVKPQTLSRELSEPLPDPGEFEGVKKVRSLAGNLGAE